MTKTASQAPRQTLPKTGKVFVYGTLKQGFGNNRFLTGAYGGKPATFLGKAVTVTAYPMMVRNVSFPYLFDVPGKGQCCWGEVFDVTDPTTMANLDRLEGVPHHYQRKTIKVILEGQDTETEVFAYFINREFHDADLYCGSHFENRSAD